MRSVEEHLSRILELVEPLPPYEQPLLEALGLPICEDVTRSIDLPTLRQLRDGRLRLPSRRRARRRPRSNPVRLPVVGESAAGPEQGLRAVARPGRQDHDRGAACRPAPTSSCRSSGPTAAGRTSRSCGSRSPANTSGRAVRTSGPGDLLLEEGTLLGPRQAAILAATGHAQVKARPRPRDRRALDRAASCASPGTSLGFDSIYDSNSFAIAAAVRQADAIAYRVGIVHRRPAGAHRHAVRPAGARRPGRDQRRRQQG